MMKRILLLWVILTSGLLSMAQFSVEISGQVISDDPVGFPVAGQVIDMVIESGGTTTSGMAISDPDGLYFAFFPVSVPQGTVILSTMNCDSTVISYTHPFGGDSATVVQHFVVCGNIPPGCNAFFDYMAIDPLTIQFLNLSAAAQPDFAWDFGDGTGSPEASPVHTYNAFGTYEVTLALFDSLTGCQSTYTTWVTTDSVNTGCVALYEALPTPMDPLTFNFMNLSQGNPDSWYWDFGDGTQSLESDPTHTFLSPGIYQVCLTIMSNDSSCQDQFCSELVLIDTLGCQAGFSYWPAPDSNNTGEFHTFMFMDQSMGYPVSWSWDFGDGGYSSEQYPVHYYTDPGVYSVCLTIETTDSCSSQWCDILVVQDDSAGCIASFTHFPDTAQGPLAVQFVDQSSGMPGQWLWDMGDGTSYSEPDPVHVYAQEGTYLVCLTISSPVCTSTWCEEIVVGNNPGCFNYFTWQTAGNMVAFEGTHSTNMPATFQWNFGDGTGGSGQQITHTYTNPGMYYVSLITDDGNCTALSDQMIMIGDSLVYQQVYGQVFEGNFPAGSGIVMIFSIDSLNPYSPFTDITLLDSNGVYIFPYVPNGDFLIYALPGDINGGYLPTYYGDVTDWTQAMVITLGDASNPYDIHLAETVTAPDPGEGMITGQIHDESLRNSGYLDKISILLYNSSMEPIGFATVDTEGLFTIHNLDWGTYYCYPELSGVPGTMLRVDLSTTSPQADLQITFGQGGFLGVAEYTAAMTAGEPWPNPAGQQISLTLDMPESATVSLLILGLDGRLYLQQEQHLNEGGHTLTMPVDNLPHGLYLMEIQRNGQQSLHRKFVH